MEKDRDLGAVLLLAARVEQQGASWQVCDLQASLRLAGHTAWKDLAGGGPKKVARGQSANKPSLVEVLSGMKWVATAGGEKVGLLSDFLVKARAKHRHPGQRASTFNALLEKSGRPGRLMKVKLPNRCGRIPWVGDQAVFRELCPFA